MGGGCVQNLQRLNEPSRRSNDPQAADETGRSGSAGVSGSGGALRGANAFDKRGGGGGAGARKPAIPNR